jgi:uncharacterized OsmC-like protein
VSVQNRRHPISQEFTMSGQQLREAIEKATEFVREHPEKGRNPNPPAVARIVDGLKCEVTGTGGERIATDMPRGVGGGGTATTPGWLMRAGLASCDATCIALRAAAQGIELSALEVVVTSESDLRGLLGTDDQVPAGLQDLRIQVRIAAPGATAEQLESLVRWACAHSPVGGADLARTRVEVRVD